MWTTRRRVATGLGLFALVAAAELPRLTGRGTAPVFVPADGSCKPAVLARLPGLSAERLEKGLGYTFALAGGRVLGKTPSRRDRLDVALLPLERVVILAGSPGDGPLLARARNGAVCGWLRREDLLIEAGAPVTSLRYGPRPLPSNPLNLPTPLGHPNRVVIAAQSSNATPSAGVAVSDVPEGQPVRLILRGQNPKIVHVFATRAAPSSREGAGERLLLVGVQGNDTSMIGWLRETDVGVLPDARVPLRSASEPQRQVPTAAVLVVPVTALAFEPATLDILASVATAACDSIDGADGISAVLRDIDNFWGLDARQALPSPAAVLTEAMRVPAQYVPDTLQQVWTELAADLRHAPPEKLKALKLRACTVAAKIRTVRQSLRSTPEPDARDGVKLGLLPLDILQ